MGSTLDLSEITEKDKSRAKAAAVGKGALIGLSTGVISNFLLPPVVQNIGLDIRPDSFSNDGLACAWFLSCVPVMVLSPLSGGVGGLIGFSRGHPKRDAIIGSLVIPLSQTVYLAFWLYMYLFLNKSFC